MKIPVEQAGKLATVATVCSLKARQTTRSCKSKTKQNKRKQNKAKLTTKQNKAKQNQQRVEIPVEQAGKLATVATVCSLTARQTTRSCKSKTKQRKEIKQN